MDHLVSSPMDHLVSSPMDLENGVMREVQIVATPIQPDEPTAALVDVGGMEEVQIVATPIQPDEPTAALVDVGGMEEVQIVATPIQPDEPTAALVDVGGMEEVQIVATPIQPDEPTAAQTEADIRFEKWKVKWLATQAELKRLHDLKPAQERFDYAVKCGQFDKVEAFLKSGEVDVNHTNFYSPLQHAAMNGHAHVVQLILKHGGDVHSVDKGGWAALHGALLAVPLNHKRCETIVGALLLHGSDVNKSGRFGKTPLHCAVLYGSSAVVKILLDHGADISKTDDNGNNTLHQLVLRRLRSAVVRNKVCRMLLDHGSCVRHKLDVLRMEDYSDQIDSDSENDIPSFTPAELADLMGKPQIAEMMNEAERICVQQIRQVKVAKLAKVEADRKLSRTALAMALHPRLGQDSALAQLGPDLLGMIGKSLY
jgi:hypothetical protein